MSELRRAFSPAQDIVLRHLWEEGVDPDVIATRLQHPRNSIYGRAKALGLPSRGRPKKAPEPIGKRTRAQVQNAHWRRVAELRRRQALGLSDPIITRPCEAMFGLPIKDVDPETRALIDRAIAERARP